MKLILTMLSLIHIASASNAGQFDDRIDAIISSAKANCGNYVFELSEQAVSYEDLSSDGSIDLAIVDEAGFSCSIGASFYCGSAGCQVHFIAEKNILSGMVQAWEIVNSNDRKSVVRLSLHGSACDQSGHQVCHKYLTISDSRASLN